MTPKEMKETAGGLVGCNVQSIKQVILSVILGWLRVFTPSGGNIH